MLMLVLYKATTELPIIFNPQTISGIFDALRHKTAIDDRKMLVRPSPSALRQKDTR